VLIEVFKRDVDGVGQVVPDEFLEGAHIDQDGAPL
jgi:hypothetical protein